MPEARPFARSNPFLGIAEKISTPVFHEREHLAPRRKTVRLALVSFPEHTVGKGSATLAQYSIVRKKDEQHVDGSAVRRQLLSCTSSHAEILNGRYRAAIDYAIHQKRADVICINELGLPCGPDGPKRALLRHLQKEAEQGPRLIMAGSYHDQRTFYNTGLLFYPGSPELGLHVHKQVSATRAEEFISVPPDRQVHCVSVFGLRIATLICLDLADFASVAAVVRAGARVDVLIVACYSEWVETLERIARAASEIMPGVVALANYRRRGQLGAVLTRFGKTVDVAPRLHRASGAHIVTHDIRIDRFREEKIRTENDLPPDSPLGWLFGRVPIRRR